MNETARAPGTGATPQSTGSAIWIALVLALTFLGSFAYACAAPLAAVAALAALTLNRTEGLVLIAMTWVVNQAVGFLLLSYPHTFSSYAWGVAIGLGAVAGLLAARAISRANVSALVAVPTTFLAAFVVYQVGMFLSASTFTSAANAFSTSIVSEVFVINVVAFAAFLVVYRVALALSLVKPMDHRIATSATA